MDAHREAVRGTAVGYYSSRIIDERAPADTDSEQVAGFSMAMAVENASGPALIIVAIDPAGEAVGFGSIIPSSEELPAVYAGSRHGRKGIGRAFVKRLEELAREAAPRVGVIVEGFLRCDLRGL